MRLPLRAALAVAASAAAALLLAVSLPPLILRKDAYAQGHNRLEALAASRRMAAELSSAAELGSGADAARLVSAYAREYPTMDFEVLGPSLEVAAASVPGPSRYDLALIAERLRSDGEGDAESFLVEAPGSGGPRYVLARMRSPFSISMSRSASVFVFNGLLLASAFALVVACAAIAAFSLPFARRMGRLSRAISAYAPGSPPVAARPGDEVGDIAAAFNGMAARLASAEEARRAAEAERRREEEARRREEEEWRGSIANLSHDLRTPLASVVGYSESLVSSAFSGEEERLRYESVIHAKALYMSGLLDSLLVLARLGAPAAGDEAAPADLCELARSIAIEYLGDAEAAGMELEADIPEAPAPALVRKDEIERALRNLLDNAVRHAASGGRLEIGLRAAEGRARIEVRDFGPGIPEEERERVFERHVRGSGAGEGRGGGLGLGLAIARAAARRSGGELVLETPEEGGCRFVLSLPLQTSVEK